MKIKTYKTKQGWLEIDEHTTRNELDKTDLANSELQRVLTSAVLSKRLVVLAGSGTSLCVNETSKMSDLWESVKDSYIRSHEGKCETWDELLSTVQQPEDSEDIEVLLSRSNGCLDFIQSTKRSEIEQFIEDAEKTIMGMVDFVERDSQLLHHEALLRRIARRTNQQDRLRLFTTNYDRCFEHAAHNAGFVVIDGFSFSQPPRFDPNIFSYDIVRRSIESQESELIEQVFYLYKMHGSIDWTKKSKIYREYPTEKPLLVYPRDSKYQSAFKQPFLEMISSFQLSLRQKDTCLLVLGVGFNDEHIAAPIMAAVNTNLSMNIVVVSPSIKTETKSNNYLKQLSRLIDGGDARITLIKATFADFVQKIPTLAKDTYLEQHDQRIAEAANFSDD